MCTAAKWNPFLSVNIGPGLEQICDVGEAGLLARRIVERRPAQPVARVQNLARCTPLLPEYELDNTFAAPPVRYKKCFEFAPTNYFQAPD
jgi:hypothetical protein